MRILFKNPEVKWSLLSFFIIQIIIMGVAVFIINKNVSTINRRIVEQNTAAIGAVVKKVPEMKDDIIACFTKPISQDIKNEGIKIAKAYGYHEEMKVKSNYIMDGLSKSIISQVEMFLFLGFLFMIIAVLFSYGNIFRKVRNTAEATERVMEGEFEVKLPYEKEGDFSLLGNEFNEMADRLKNSISALKEEKIFLKNIISDISHQLKTPLASCMVFTELIGNDRFPAEKKGEILEKTTTQLERMEWLIINLLKIAKMEAGVVDFNMNNEYIKETVEMAIEPLIIKAEDKNQEIVIKENKKDVMLNHDINWMSESLTNIIKNCIEHTGVNGKIIIEIDETPVLVSLTIEDNGEGISKEELPHIFERFFKSRGSSKEGSIGIGLALAKSIIEHQGGDIRAESKIGEGTKFTIIFIKGII